jgi:hypothetical protein
LKKDFALLRLCVTFFFFSSLVLAQQRADFIIIEKPQRLTILDHYQQQLSPQEKSSLRPFSPYRIINPDETLGDGLTLCMKVEANGGAMYFVKDEAGELIGGEDARSYRNVVALADTITIIKRNTIELFDAGGRKRSPLAEGTRLRRVFQSRLTFVHVLASGALGWANLRAGENNNWMIVRGATTPSSKTLDQLLPDIQLKLNGVNSQLAKLYDIWNRKAVEYRVAPQWNLQPSSDVLFATLSGDSLAQFYKESTRWLAKDIELLLLGTNFHAAATTGRIEIR